MRPMIAEFLVRVQPQTMKTSELIEAITVVRELMDAHEPEKAALREKLREIHAEIDRRVPVP